ncbi:hypothetical protein ACFYTF_06320 [Nocardia thailandica]|uniref:PIN domain-containing protein n=1 Tax=Nocardia thailandica TaxID=257275 RepID=A0ABW6PJ95_9NOCA
MSGVVTFLDTSVLCNILAVPHMDQDRASVRTEMRLRADRGETFILPVTTVIETGNHIRHIDNGDYRRKAADRFATLLRNTLEDQAPWSLHTLSWSPAFLRDLLAGAGTGMQFVDHAQAGLGCGDLCIICERNVYQQRSGIAQVTVWTLDGPLAAHLP